MCIRYETPKVVALAYRCWRRLEIGVASTMSRLVLHMFALVILCGGPPAEGQGDECTSGFMTVGRIEDLLDHGGFLIPGASFQVMFPEVGFTCRGSIQSWVFGADWVRQNGLDPELQIWRPVGEGGSFIKVGSTSITPEQSQTQLYEYPLSSPLAFRAGDVLGFYQPDISLSQLRIYFERDGRGERHNGHYVFSSSPASVLNIPLGAQSDRYQLLINVITDSPDCVRGFMSVQKIRQLLSLDPLISTGERQQISPDMSFTCDGMITKWIIGADWSFDFRDKFYPELQVWRNIGNDTYQKINGTSVFIPFDSASKMYVYSDFAPIPVKSGDILGIFIPRTVASRLRVLSENVNSPTQYYLPTGDSGTSPHNVIDIENNLTLTSNYHPLVSVEIVRNSTKTVMPTAVGVVSSVGVQPTVPTQQHTAGNVVYIGVGVGVTVVVLLIVAAALVVSMVVCLRHRASKELPDTADNTAYGVRQDALELSGNPVHSAITTGDEDGVYECITSIDASTATTSNLFVSTNHA